MMRPDIIVATDETIASLRRLMTDEESAQWDAWDRWRRFYFVNELLAMVGLRKRPPLPSLPNIHREPHPWWRNDA